MLHPLFIPFAFAAKHGVVNGWIFFFKKLRLFTLEKKTRERSIANMHVSEQVVVHAAKPKCCHPRFFLWLSCLSLAMVSGRAGAVRAGWCPARSWQGTSAGWKGMKLGLVSPTPYLHCLVHLLISLWDTKRVVLVQFGCLRPCFVYFDILVMRRSCKHVPGACPSLGMCVLGVTLRVRNEVLAFCCFCCFSRQLPREVTAMPQAFLVGSSKT